MDNFTGRPVEGYEAPRMIATIEAAEALKKANDLLKSQGYMLVVYDAYRPQRAVGAFMRWSQEPEDQTNMRKYYPTLDKKSFFKLGYVAATSPHSRGSTLSVTLIQADTPLKAPEVMEHRLANGKRIPYLDDNTLDMGSSFDLFHEASYHDSPLIGAEQTGLRNMLRQVMKKCGFVANKLEWWSYTLKKEPYKDQYFNFVDLPRKPVDVDFERIKQEARRAENLLDVLPGKIKAKG